MSAKLWVALLIAAAAPSAAAAQGLADGVARVGTGTVRFSYATRPDVLICDDGIQMGEHHTQWGSNGEWTGRNCRNGPAEVELEVREGRVRGVELVRRTASRTRGAVDLGEVPAPGAARYLLQLGRTAPTRAGEHAVFAAVLANVEGIWRELLGVARDRSVTRSVRKSALFWVGQEAADSATRGLSEVAADDGEEQDIRNAAVFALSRRPADESVPVLMDLARTAGQAETRRTAMFWLAQSEDPRVPAFFERILVGSGGG